MDPLGGNAGHAEETEVVRGQDGEPVLVKVIVKMFKVVEKTEQEAKVGNKHLNTKTFKVEASLEKKDFKSKQTLVAAIEKAADVIEMAKAESILNPKLEISVQ